MESRNACDRSVQYILRGQYDAALRQLDGAKSSGASPADVENLRGLALMLQGKLQPALSSFARALELQPSLQEALYNRGLALLRTGRYEAASADFERLWKDASSTLRADAAYHNGIALDRLGRHADAESWLSRAFELDPQLDGALLYIGMLRERKGDLQGAGRAYLDYLARHPNSATAALRFGLAAHRAGRSDVARRYLQQVVDSSPGSLDAHEARKFLVMWGE
ncbi:MAG TPA: tetratricopeptide repeat protein [Thermoanaerobaculia bacterium]